MTGRNPEDVTFAVLAALFFIGLFIVLPALEAATR